MTVNGVALGDLILDARQWIGDKVRVDQWTLDAPRPYKTLETSILYPPNCGIVHPPRQVNYEINDFGLYGSAEIQFSIGYRFYRELKYAELPLDKLANLVNNIYFQAVTNPQGINPSIMNLRTPDNGIDINVGNIEGNADNDWIVTLVINFYVEFKAALGSTSGINPDVTEPSFEFNKLDIIIYRTAIGDFQDNRIDREFTFTS